MGGSQSYGYLFGGPHNKDYNILGSILGSPFLRKLPYAHMYKYIMCVITCSLGILKGKSTIVDMSLRLLHYLRHDLPLVRRWAGPQVVMSIIITRIRTVMQGVMAAQHQSCPGDFTNRMLRV